MTPTLNLINWIFALSPVLVVLIMMLGFRAGGTRAGGMGWLAAVLVAVLFFGAGFELLAVAHIKSILLSLDVLYIIWMALFLFHVAEEAGAIRMIGQALPKLTEDRVMQSLLIGWLMVTFIQGTGGFGVPVAVCAPILMAIGFTPLQAVAMASLGDTWAVSFGSLGISFQALLSVTGLSAKALAPLTAILLGAASFPGGLLVVLIGNGWKSLKRALLPVSLLSVVMGFTQYLLVTNGMWTLGATGAGLVGLAVGLLLLRLPAYRNKNQVEHKPGVEGENPDAGKSLWLALVCYALLILLAFGVNLVKPVDVFLSQVKFSLDFPEVRTSSGWLTPAGPGQRINLFGHPGAILLYSSLLSAAIYRMVGYHQPGSLKRILQKVVRGGVNSSLGILAMVGLASIMLHSGMTYLLAEGLSTSISRDFYPLVAPFIGALGAFITGSNTNSNVLFGALQQNSALLLNLSVPLVLAAQSAGGSVGSVLAPAKVIVGCSTVGLSGEEGDVMRKIIGYGLIPIATVALVTWIIHLLG
ncbi:MAG: L-lactate permease [Chloroflexi bacterium]|nr:L-lactate permease [Chloroflexota bacterium]